MHIKNILLLSIVCTATVPPIHAMESITLWLTAMEDEKSKQEAFFQAKEYLHFEQTQKLHRENSSPETQLLFEEACAQAINTKEFHALTEACQVADNFKSSLSAD